MTGQTPEQLEPIPYASDEGPGRPRRFGWLVAFVAAAVMVSGVIGYYIGASAGEDAVRMPSVTPSTGTFIGRVSLVLGRDNSGVAEWEFSTPDLKVLSRQRDDGTAVPTFVVLAKVSPPDADITFAVHMASGQVRDMGRTSEDLSCHQDPEATRCRFTMGIGTDAGAETWVLRLEKKSAVDAEVETTVFFEKP